MAHGYAGMASFVSLQMGLVWVVGCILLFAGAYLIGSKKGGRAAAKYTATITLFFLVGFAAILAYAYIIGEAQLFLETYTPAVVIEMMLLALGCVWIMWFMATQYSRGRIAIDERFGSKENYLRAKEAAKRASANGGLMTQDMQAAPAMPEQAVPMDAYGQLQPDGQAAVAGIPGADGGVTPIPAASLVDLASAGQLDATATNVMPAVDPTTGLPVAAPGQTPAAVAPAAAPAAPVIDPHTGQPMAPAVDPATGLPVQAQAAPAPVAAQAAPEAMPQQPQQVAAPVPAPAPVAPVAPAAPAPAIDPYAGQAMPAAQTAPGVLPGQPAPTAAPPAPAPAIDPYTGQAIPGLGQAVPQVVEAPTPEMVTPLPLGPSAPNVMPDSNEQWLQQLEPAAIPPVGMGEQAAVAPFDPFAQPMGVSASPAPAIDPYTGQPSFAPPAFGGQPDPYAVPPQAAMGMPGQAVMPGAPAPAVDPYTGQPVFAPEQPYGQPGFAPPAFGGQPDPYAVPPQAAMGMPEQAAMPGAPAPAIDPYTGHPIPAPGQTFGHPPVAAAPAPDAAFNPYGQPPAHPPHPQMPPQPGYGQAPPPAPGPYGY